MTFPVFFLFFLFSWLLLSLQMPAPHSLILLHLSVSLTEWMVSFACGNSGLIHLERRATVCVRIRLGRKEYQLLRLNDWQSPCNYSYTSWYPVCFLPPATNLDTSCVFVFAFLPPSLEQREGCWRGVLIHSSSCANHYLCGICSQEIF